MNYYLIRFAYYQSLGDGWHDNGELIRLVRADSIEEAEEKLILQFSRLSLSDFENLTIH